MVFAAWCTPSGSKQIDFGTESLNSAKNIRFVRSPHSRRVTVAQPETIDTNILRDAVSKDILRILPRMFRRGSQTVIECRNPGDAALQRLRFVSKSLFSFL